MSVNGLSPGLKPLAEPLEFLPGEYVLLEDTEGEVPPRSYSRRPAMTGTTGLLFGGWVSATSQRG